jgi:hypothetical protein
LLLISEDGILEIMEKVVQIGQHQQVPEAPKMPEKVLKSFSPKMSKSKKGLVFMIIVGLVVILAGVGSGWMLSTKIKAGGQKSPTSGANQVVDKSTGEVSVAGADESNFPDTAEGTLKTGGIEGEGTHHLDRNMGPEKDVYLFSTSINLDDFVDKKVQVWGQTVSGKKAGWLMDVGRVKVLD